MQTLALAVWRTLSAASPESVLVAHRGSNHALPIWLPYALARTAKLVASGRVNFVLTGDAAMYAAARPVIGLYRVPAATMVHGRDLTYENAAYRMLVPRALRRAETIIANSEATAAITRNLGVAPSRVRVVRLGVDAPDVSPEDRVAARPRLNSLLGTSNCDFLLLTLGRLVKRKGVAWFLESVLPHLPRNVSYIVAGTGEDEARVRRLVERLDLGTRVHLRGQVDDDERELLLRGADVFVQPNVVVEGDMEGFGQVAIEAAMRGLYVVAADLEGLSEAVVGGITGTLLPSGQADQWVKTLSELSADREQTANRARSFQHAARNRYSERAMGEELVRALRLSAPAR